jgi:hypothetical protein
MIDILQQSMCCQEKNFSHVYEAHILDLRASSVMYLVKTDT